MLNKILLAISAAAALGLLATTPAFAQFQRPVVAIASTNSGQLDKEAAMDLYDAGGGPGSFSIVRALDSMIGENALQTELTSLADIYGQPNVDRFTRIFNYAAADAWTRLGDDNVSMPTGNDQYGQSLAAGLVRDGTAADGTFRIAHLFDSTLTPRVYAQVKRDMVARYGSNEAATFDRMANQLFFDVSQIVGANVSLAPNQ